MKPDKPSCLPARLSAIAFFLAHCGWQAPATAQVVLDGSLGRSGTLAGPNYAVTADLGRQVGGNLFHSFAQFSLSSGQTATFSGPATVTNIINRVTGGQVSNIDGGIVSTISGANFYFLNPSGIIFGPNASLDIGGSGYFSTADHLRFADGAQFNASLDATSTLTVAEPSAFGFLGDGANLWLDGASLNATTGKSLHFEAGSIELTDATLTSSGGGIALLSQATGETRMTNSQVQAFSAGDLAPGRVRIVGGRITLDSSRIYSSNTTAAEASPIDIAADDRLYLTNSRVQSYASGDGKGADTTASAWDAWLDGSWLLNNSSGAGASGGVMITAGNKIMAYGYDFAFKPSFIGNEISAEGWAGNVSVTAQSLDLWDGAQLRSLVLSNSSGRGGNIYANIGGTAYFSGVDFAGFPSGIISESYGFGTAGDISLIVDALKLRNGALVSTSTFSDWYGAGNAGNIFVTAIDRIDISGVNANGRPSLIRSSTSGTGNAGFLSLTAPRIDLRQGGRILSSTYDTLDGAGNGGFILLNVSESLTVDGVDIDNEPSAIATESYGPGDAGYISVTAGNVYLTGGGRIDSTTYGTDPFSGSGGHINLTIEKQLKIDGTSSDSQVWKSGVIANSIGTGDAGSVWIDAGTIEISNGALITSTSLGEMTGSGAGGFLTINAESLTLSGIGPVGKRHPSGIFTETSGSGGAGFISINVGQLVLADGAQISSNSYSEASDAGEGGFISITARGPVRLTGSGTTGESSKISADTFGPGEGGDINIEAASLEISNGAQIASEAKGETLDAGAGGYISLDVHGPLTVSGLGINNRRSGIYATTEGPGDAGHITLTAHELQILDGALVSSSTLGSMDFAGAGGNILIDVSGSTKISGINQSCNNCRSAIAAESDSEGNAGYIWIDTGSLSVLDGGLISSSAFDRSSFAGNAGVIRITARDDIVVSGTHALHGTSSRISSASFGSGTAGNIFLTGRNITLSSGGHVISDADADTNDTGEWGAITVEAIETLRIDGFDPVGGRSGIFTNTSGNAYAGDIVINSKRLELLNGGVISSSAFGTNDNARGEGIIEVNSNSVHISGIGLENVPSGIYTETFGPGDAGWIDIYTDTLTLASGGLISSASRGAQDNAGAGGSIFISARQVSLTGTASDGQPALISAESFGPGTAGSIEINASDKLTLAGGAEIATQTDFSDGGNITIRAGELLKLSHSSITTSVGSGFGNGGNIDIDPRFVVLNNGFIQANAYGGNGGNIRIVTDHLVSSTDSRIEASSELGIDGSIEVSSPNVDVGSGLTVLPSRFLDASLLLRDSCAASSGRSESSSFVGAGNGGLPSGPDRPFPSRYHELSLVPAPIKPQSMLPQLPPLLAANGLPCRLH